MRVLVADDDDAVLMALELLLRRERIPFVCARSPREVLAALASARGAGETFDAILLDLNYERDTTSGTEGFSLLDELKRLQPDVPVVVMTGWASIEGAVQAIRRGAVDYVPKPWDNARLVALLRSLLPAPVVRESPTADAASAPHGGRGFASPAMREVLATIAQVAFSDVAILVTGEHGTGKEIIARLIHEKSGRRGAFVAVNAGALPEGTFESELFGHVRGAFTDAKGDRAGAFARARDGTLFLDEIANMPLSQQAKLLRVLQERAYQPLGAAAPEVSTARIVSATNVDVAALTADGRFRPDLMYRLNTIHLELPALRARREEIPGLVARFVRREAERYGLPLPVLDDGVLARIEEHDWPGNVRELEHALQRAVLLSVGGGRVTVDHLGLRTVPASVPPASAGAVATIKDAERAAVLQALARFPDDRIAAAKSLGLSRSAFYRRLTQLGIRPPR